MSILSTLTTFNDSQWEVNQALTNAYHQFDRIYDPSTALRKEPDIWEKIRNDADFLVAMNDRVISVAGKEWQFEPATDVEEDKAVADLQTQHFQHIQNFTMARRGIASDGIFRGRAFRKILGARKLLAPRIGGKQYPPAMWWVPTHLKDVDPNRFAFRPIRYQDETGRERVKVVAQMWDIARAEWVDWLDHDRFIKVVFDDGEQRLGYGRGLIQAAYFYWWFKGIVLKRGIEALKLWAGGGLVVGKIDASAAGGTDRTSDEVRDDFLEAIEEGRERGAIAIDKNDEATVVSPSSEGWKMVTEALAIANNAVTRLFSGSLRPTGGGSEGASGAKAQASVESDTSEGLRQGDREVIDEAITRDAVALWHRLNWSNLVALGLAGAGKAKFRTAQRAIRDPKIEAEINSMALAAGMPLDKDDAYQSIGRKRPKEGDDVILPRPDPAPAFPGFSR